MSLGQDSDTADFVDEAFRHFRKLVDEARRQQEQFVSLLAEAKSSSAHLYKVRGR